MTSRSFSTALPNPAKSIPSPLIGASIGTASQRISLDSGKVRVNAELSSDTTLNADSDTADAVLSVETTASPNLFNPSGLSAPELGVAVSAGSVGNCQPLPASDNYCPGIRGRRNEPETVTEPVLNALPETVGKALLGPSLSGNQAR